MFFDDVHPKSSFDRGQEGMLFGLLEMVAADEGFWPSERIMRLVHGMVSRWAPELVIAGAGRILLTKYCGDIGEWSGFWHIPGGYDQKNDETFEAACQRKAREEIGAEVVVGKILRAYKWRNGEHPYGRPLSIFTEVHPVKPVEEIEDRRFFEVDRLPRPMIAVHEKFIKDFLTASN